jgi:hypothetical protein
MAKKRSNVEIPFKVGDWVISNYPDKSNGLSGVIKERPNSINQGYLVDFGFDFDGHNGIGDKNPGTCWYMPSRSLIPSESMMVKKIMKKYENSIN